MEMIKNIIIIITIIIVLYCIFLTIFFFSIGSNIPNHINKRSLSAINIDMNKSEIKKILGEPISIDGSCFNYAKKGFLSGPEIYICFKNNKVNRILMEDFDSGFYICSKEACPGIIDQKIYDNLIPD